MRTMLVIIIPAAILAALVCFRSVRTLAMIGFAVLVVWAITQAAHAQSSPIVQCDIGDYGRYRVADYVCDAMALGYPHLKDVPPGDLHPNVQACTDEMNRWVHAPPGVIFNTCYHMWLDNVRGAAMAGGR